MQKINSLLETLATPFKPIAHWILRLGLGISFFLHGYGTVSYTHLTLPTTPYV